ncbi:MAG: ATP-binding protein [Anaerolineae bacterium]|nr:ATP-binding protein [Anaerolineae bacterium]
MAAPFPLPQTLIILSGLPGCGKTTLARLLVQELRLPILTIDDVVDAIPTHMTGHSERFWEDMVHILLHLVDAQLAWGHSVIVDSVFMGVDENQTQHRWSDRQRAYEIAQHRQVNFRPIYLHISDETVWQERLAQRARQFPDAPTATWTQVDTQRRYFQPWQPGQALFLDGLNSVEDNFAAAMSLITDPIIRLTGWD